MKRLLALLAALTLPALAADETALQLRLRRETGAAGAAGSTPAWVADAQARGVWRPSTGLSLGWAAEASARDLGASATRTDARLDELHAGVDLDAWQLSAGRKVVAWDVGYGFRPNDLVQQQPRRTLIDQPTQGRAVVMAETFGADDALSFVWVNPGRHRDEAPPNDPAEAALAVRAYRRAAGLDLSAYGRWGVASGSSVGAAVAGVAGDALEWHASARALAHGGRGTTAAVPRAGQLLLGGTWTGSSSQSLLVEAWWDDLARARSLRGNLFARLSWQPDAWTFAVDTLVTPADRGHLVTASAQWQGDRWRVEAAWRQAGGPSGAVFSHLPQRRAAVLALTWTP